MYGYIYLTENLINGRKYIGKKASSKFLGEKYLGSGKALNVAINKYGKENFKVIMIDTAESLEELNQKEIYYIAINNAQESKEFYNISAGGLDGGPLFKGHKHTEETKQRIGDSVRGEKNGFYGKHHTEETRKVMSKKNVNNELQKMKLVLKCLKLVKVRNLQKSIDVRLVKHKRVKKVITVVRKLQMMLNKKYPKH